MYNELTSNPMFGLILSMAVYLIALALFKKFPFPLLNPLIVSIAVIILILVVCKIPYENYYIGGQMLNVLITPATVALAIPLYKTFHLLKKHAKSISIGIITGSLLGTFLTGVFAVLLGVGQKIIVSIMPKSVTTAIALGITEKMGGVTAVTLVMVIFTGVIGAIIGPSVLKWFKITDPVAQGIALGSSAHAIGTSKALEMGRVQGAMAGLAIGVTGIVTVFAAPFMMGIVNRLFF